MYGNATLVTTLTAKQLTELLRQVVRTELASFVPTAPQLTALPDFPTRRQTRDALGITYSTLTNWSRPYKDRPARLVPIKLGTRVRYRREDVLALLQEAQRQKAMSQRAND